MFIQKNAFIVSVLLHLFLFLILILYYQKHVPSFVISPEKRLISLTIQSHIKMNSIPVEKPQTEKPLQELTQVVPTTPVIKTPLVKEEPLFEENTQEKIEPALTENLVKDTPGHITPLDKQPYVYSVDSIISLDDTPNLPVDEPTLDDLLIDEPELSYSSNSLFSFELKGNRSREILNTPDILFDSSDPVLATLENCKISFHITREGLLRNIEMRPPGTGSMTYDEILENILSQFLFVPGEADQGLIYINFSLVEEDVHE